MNELDSMNFPPGTIVVPTDFAARYTSFYISLLRTKIPNNTQFAIGMGSEIAENRNKAILDRYGEWVWFIDDDHFWDEDLLLKLLSHDVDIVAPLVMNKLPPFNPLVYLKMNEDGEHVHLKLSDVETPGLMEVFAVGTGGLLVKNKVFETLGYPWFEMGRGFSSYSGEDLYFCHKARQAGFKIWVDLANPLGHINVSTIYGSHREGKWGIEVDLGMNQRIFLPITDQ